MVSKKIFARKFIGKFNTTQQSVVGITGHKFAYPCNFINFYGHQNIFMLTNPIIITTNAKSVSNQHKNVVNKLCYCKYDRHEEQKKKKLCITSSNAIKTFSDFLLFFHLCMFEIKKHCHNNTTEYHQNSALRIFAYSSYVFKAFCLYILIICLTKKEDNVFEWRTDVVLNFVKGSIEQKILISRLKL